MSARTTARLFSLLIGLAFGDKFAVAIPNQAFNPHSDAAAEISYIQDNTKSPDATNHFHLPLRDGETITVSNDKDNFGLISNKGWTAGDVWDNNLLRFEDTPDMGDSRNALLNNFAHGYIDAAKAPLYKFDASVPAEARTLLAECYTTWIAAAQEQVAGKTSPSGKALSLGLAFKEAGAGQVPQFDYAFNGNLQGSRKIYGEWVVSQDRVGGVVQSKNTMDFETNPANYLFAPDGYTIKIKGDIGSGQSITKSVGWSFDKTPEAIEVDLQYIDKDLVVFDELPPGKKMVTNSDIQIECTDKVKFYEMDFYTIALHETGHILGLLHAPDNPANNIMRAKIEDQASWNRVFQKVDNNSAYGAALLYTIPVPEPSGLMLAVLGSMWIAVLVGLRTKRPGDSANR